MRKYTRTAPYGGYLGVALWPDGQWRRNDPVRYRRVTNEVLEIIDILIMVNRTGLFSASFEYMAYFGLLEIEVIEGVWSPLKDPVFKLDLDCCNYPLTDDETGMPINPASFLERMILLVQ